MVHWWSLLYWKTIKEKRGKMSIKIFSEEFSIPFWNNLKQIENIEDVKNVIYMMGCMLQDMENKYDKRCVAKIPLDEINFILDTYDANNDAVICDRIATIREWIREVE